ncbi:jg13208 [Pararge aegeria aegeria]|uniref:Jg13208 protein n=1 Tax=Pararge aegeria aegeria TaxID=348720 RepID=A0A8S4RDH7_9NEOP|nr:jg13208 [Pararge aegeria aegeria]
MNQTLVLQCAAGRAAWQEAAALSVGGGGAGAGGAARRCSVLGDHPGARRDPRGKWHRTNRVRDASYGSSSDSDGEFEGASGEPWGVARLLYAGLATLALGLVVYFVGTGDKGFKTPALRLVGPSLIVAGLACCLLRIMFCIFAKPCCRRRTNHKENRRLSGCVEGEEMPLARCASSRQGPAQCSPARRLDASSCDVSSLSSGEEDERLRRYRTANATTTTATHLQPQTVHVQPAGSQPKPPPSLQSAQATAGKRPPPRNVSFAGGPDGELVLSPAQLRS